MGSKAGFGGLGKFEVSMDARVCELLKRSERLVLMYAYYRGMNLR